MMAESFPTPVTVIVAEFFVNVNIPFCHEYQPWSPLYFYNFCDQVPVTTMIYKSSISVRFLCGVHTKDKTNKTNGFYIIGLILTLQY